MALGVGSVVGDQRRFIQSGEVMRRLPLLFLRTLLPVLIQLEVKVRLDRVLVALLYPVLCEFSI